MSAPAQETREGSAGLSLPRRIVGSVLAAVVVAAAVLFAAGAANPWRLAVLERYFADPLFGAFAVGVGGYGALWLLAPIRNEAAARGRITARVVAAVVAAAGLLAWGAFGMFFRQEITEIARTEDGSRAVVQVVRATDPYRYELRVWVGGGLAAREAGSLGLACGGADARFVTPDLVELDTSYGTWQLSLDPDTGEPREVLGPRCSEGPVPATLGR
jgi:hypothetical protein